MLCWICGVDAAGTCRFCGRAMCKEHAREKPFLFEAWDQGDSLRGLAVEDALHCGVCTVHSSPITLDFLRTGAPVEGPPARPSGTGRAG